MSNVMKPSDSIVKYQMQINFAAPGALNTDVNFTDADTGATFYQLRAGNVISDVAHTLDPAAGLTYTLFVGRQDLSRKRVGTTANFLVAFNGQQRPNMPRGIAGGWFRFIEQQAAGALTAQNYLVTFQQPLAV